MIIARSNLNIPTQQQYLDLSVESLLVAFDLFVYRFAFAAVGVSHGLPYGFWSGKIDACVLGRMVFFLPLKVPRKKRKKERRTEAESDKS